jgi:RES domain-containing protein
MHTRPLQELVATAPTRYCKGTGYRSVSVTYHSKPLSLEGSRRKSGRFHARGKAEAIYIALDPVTALYEVGLLLQTDQGIDPQPSNPRTLFTIHYDLPRTLDLRDDTPRDHLGYDSEAIKSNWRRVTPNAPTQRLGNIAFRAGIQGIIYPSAQYTAGSNLVVFPRNLIVGMPGQLRVEDSAGALAHTLP